MKNILIIEDDANVAKALGLRMKFAGYHPVLAHDAITGLSTAVKVRPDLVLLDINMPGGNGFSVAERIQNVVSRETPIFFLTASRQPGLVDRAQAAGAAGYFEKPYPPRQLLSAVERQLGPGE